MDNPEFQDFIEVIPNRLCWAVVKQRSLPRETSEAHYFSVDRVFVYEPFFMDFGPLNLGHTHRYCKLVEEKLKSPALHGKRIVHCCSADPRRRTNAAYLIGAFLVVIQGQSAEAAFEHFANLPDPLLLYRDASPNPRSVFGLSVFDCLYGLECSIRSRLFDSSRFNVDCYEFFGQVENGDMSWVLPGRFLAFAGPHSENQDDQGFPTWTPEDYIPLFLDAGIRLVIRLNRNNYNRNRFIENGIQHADLYFLDGTCPTKEIIANFLHIVERECNPIAIHCKAGLGRTGTLIGLYAMKHLRFPARAFIGWSRICRPGSILGPQQQFLVDMQDDMFRAGLAGLPIKEDKLCGDIQALNIRDLHEHETKEDKGQGEALREAKRGQSKWRRGHNKRKPKH